MQEPCLHLGCTWSVALTSEFLMSWKAVVAGEVHFSSQLLVVALSSLAVVSVDIMYWVLGNF